MLKKVSILEIKSVGTVFFSGGGGGNKFYLYSVFNFSEHSLKTKLKFKISHFQDDGTRTNRARSRELSPFLFNYEEKCRKITEQAYMALSHACCLHP